MLFDTAVSEVEMANCCGWAVRIEVDWQCYGIELWVSRGF
jgi:hypothetical protein